VIGTGWGFDDILPLPVAAGDGLRRGGLAVIRLAFLLALVSLLSSSSPEPVSNPGARARSSSATGFIVSAATRSTWLSVSPRSAPEWC
jgi:hypothetical protein